MQLKEDNHTVTACIIYNYAGESCCSSKHIFRFSIIFLDTVKNKITYFVQLQEKNFMSYFLYAGGK